jgi:hypothetical protein
MSNDDDERMTNGSGRKVRRKARRRMDVMIVEDCAMVNDFKEVETRGVRSVKELFYSNNA